MESLLQAITIFQKGGPVMYLLLLCSLAVVSIAVERFIYYRNMNTDASAFIAGLKPLLERQRLAEAIQFCEKTPAAISQIAFQGLSAYQKGNSAEGALEAATLLLAARLREYLNFLSAIVTLAPLFGLLGTVIGMISSFSVFNVQAGQPMAITGGVGEALVATASGLSVAALAMIMHTYFSHRVDLLITDMEQVNTQLLYALSPKRTVRRENHEIA
ncbi:MAG: MotA/TolQ/ExbB proton channel [Firmicutes bacterium]|nr:MotA/TolQ/ExbB proton channel [Bacillota bacterium]